MKRVYILLVLLVGCFVGGKYFYDHRTEFHFYHLMLLKFRGDVALKRTSAQYHTKFIPEKYVSFRKENTAKKNLYPTWAFRLSHSVPTYAMPAIDDTDNDGIPEVYVGSYSKKLYVLDGRTGQLLWDWQLPFGVIGGRSVIVSDLDNDSKKEVIFGSHTSLPIRVYALHTAKHLNQHKRLKWVRNISGDFMEGGLNIAELNNKKYVIALSRDAPYSRGSVNIIGPKGGFLRKPVTGIDVCMNRPAVGILTDGKQLSFIHGSHKWYNARFGNKLVARELQTGKVLWSVDMPGDTGFQQHQIVDVDFDGNNEVIAYAGWKQEGFVLNGRTGEFLYRLKGKVFGYVKEDRRLFIQNKNRISCLDENGKVIYTKRFASNKTSFGVRSFEDGKFLLINLFLKEERLFMDVYNAKNGKRRLTYSAPFPELPQHVPSSDYGVFEPPDNTEIRFLTLADTDNDGYWDALVQNGDYTVNIHLPLKVHPKYDRYAPIPLRNVDNRGWFFAFADNR